MRWQLDDSKITEDHQRTECRLRLRLSPLLRMEAREAEAEAVAWRRDIEVCCDPSLFFKQVSRANIFVFFYLSVIIFYYYQSKQ